MQYLFLDLFNNHSHYPNFTKNLDGFLSCFKNHLKFTFDSIYCYFWTDSNYSRKVHLIFGRDMVTPTEPLMCKQNLFSSYFIVFRKKLYLTRFERLFLFFDNCKIPTEPLMCFLGGDF